METTAEEPKEINGAAEEKLLKEKLAKIMEEKEEKGVEIMNKVIAELKTLGLEIVPRYTIEGTAILQSGLIIRAKK